jgi:hypothetical protein
MIDGASLNLFLGFFFGTGFVSFTIIKMTTKTSFDFHVLQNAPVIVVGAWPYDSPLNGMG